MSFILPKSPLPPLPPKDMSDGTLTLIGDGDYRVGALESILSFIASASNFASMVFLLDSYLSSFISPGSRSSSKRRLSRLSSTIFL